MASSPGAPLAPPVGTPGGAAAPLWAVGPPSLRAGGPVPPISPFPRTWGSPGVRGPRSAAPRAGGPGSSAPRARGPPVHTPRAEHLSVRRPGPSRTRWPPLRRPRPHSTAGTVRSPPRTAGCWLGAVRSPGPGGQGSPGGVDTSPVSGTRWSPRTPRSLLSGGTVRVSGLQSSWAGASWNTVLLIPGTSSFLPYWTWASRTTCLPPPRAVRSSRLLSPWTWAPRSSCFTSLWAVRTLRLLPPGRAVVSVPDSQRVGQGAGRRRGWPPLVCGGGRGTPATWRVQGAGAAVVLLLLEAKVLGVEEVRGEAWGTEGSPW